MKTIIAMLVLAVPLAARADSLDEAKAAFAAGKAAFERADYDTALAQFQRANLLAPAPSLSYNIGKTYERLGRNRDAVLAFERYLELAGQPQNDDERKFQESLRQQMGELRKQPDRTAPRPAPPPGQPQHQPMGPAQPQQPAYPPQYPPQYPQPYANYNPYTNYNPYGGAYAIDPRQARLDAAKRKRDGGLKSIIAGSILLGLGAAFIGGSAPLTSGYNDFSTTDGLWGAVLLVLGVPCAITGAIILPIGVANMVKGSAEYSRLTKEPQAPVPGQPRAVLFPALSFQF